MRDAERLQIGNDLGRIVEAEIRGELQPVGCERNGGRHQQPPTRQNTDQGGSTVTGDVAPDRRAGIASRGKCARPCPTDWPSGADVVPSPMRQCAVSRPLSARCGVAEARTPQPRHDLLCAGPRAARAPARAAASCSGVRPVPIEHGRLQRRRRRADRGCRRHIAHRPRHIPACGLCARRRQDRPGNRRRTGRAASRPIPRP